MQQRQMLLPDAREARQRQRAEQRQRLDVVDVLELADVEDRDKPPLSVGLPRQGLRARKDAAAAVAVPTRKAAVLPPSRGSPAAS